MVLPIQQFHDIFVCRVCQGWLHRPVTLSCGYTVCRSCVANPECSSYTHTVQTFKCPVTECNLPTHLFGPHQEMPVDIRVQALCDIAQQALSTCYSSFERKGKGVPSDQDSIKKKLFACLLCDKCSCLLQDPVTTHCGHSFCRLCLLHNKATSPSCPSCVEPLPSFNCLSSKMHVNVILQSTVAAVLAVFHCHGLAAERDRVFDPEMPDGVCKLFVSGHVILPHQRKHLHIAADADIDMFRNALFTSKVHNCLCIANVHRGDPKTPQFGTMVNIKSMERSIHGTYMAEVVGMQRFKVTIGDSREWTDTFVKVALVPDQAGVCELADPVVPPKTSDGKIYDRQFTLSPSSTVQDAAETIHAFMIHIAQHPQSMPHVLSTSTAGLLGPRWLANAQRTHGSLPPSSDASALLWWTASVVPVSDLERYQLLKTARLCDRMSLVLSWLQQLDTQWRATRQMAISCLRQVYD